MSQSAHARNVADDDAVATHASLGREGRNPLTRGTSPTTNRESRREATILHCRNPLTRGTSPTTPEVRLCEASYLGQGSQSAHARNVADDSKGARRLVSSKTVRRNPLTRGTSPTTRARTNQDRVGASRNPLTRGTSPTTRRRGRSRRSTGPWSQSAHARNVADDTWAEARCLVDDAWSQSAHARNVADDNIRA